MVDGVVVGVSVIVPCLIVYMRCLDTAVLSTVYAVRDSCSCAISSSCFDHFHESRPLGKVWLELVIHMSSSERVRECRIMVGGTVGYVAHLKTTGMAKPRS